VKRCVEKVRLKEPQQVIGLAEEVNAAGAGVLQNCVMAHGI
jgi:hypothetical protein